MRQPIFYPILALLIFVSSAQAQIGSWEDVEDIPSGTTIFVQADRYSAKCVFDHATDRTLFCEQVYRSLDVSPREISFDRGDIRQVAFQYTREGNVAKGALIGVGVGAAAGAVSGANRDARDRLGAAIIVGAIGGMFGVLFASGFRSIHTKVVYQQ